MTIRINSPNIHLHACPNYDITTNTDRVRQSGSDDCGFRTSSYDIWHCGVVQHTIQPSKRWSTIRVTNILRATNLGTCLSYPICDSLSLSSLSGPKATSSKRAIFQRSPPIAHTRSFAIASRHNKAKRLGIVTCIESLDWTQRIGGSSTGRRSGSTTNE